MRMILSVYGIVLKDTKVLMHKRCNTNYGAGYWSLPGGHVEPHESFSEAVSREIREEAAIEAHPEQCDFKLMLIRKPQDEKRYINFFYTVQRWRGSPTIADGKASEMNFFSPDALPEPTLPYIKEALGLIEKGVPLYESLY